MKGEGVSASSEPFFSSLSDPAACCRGDAAPSIYGHVIMLLQVEGEPA